MEAQDLLKAENKHLLDAAISHDLDARFQSVVLNYLNCIQKSLIAIQKGEAIDTEAISTLGDSIRLLLIMQKQFRKEE